MTEQQLREFGIRAEQLVTLPDFADLDRRGQQLRRRRRAIVAGVAACLLLVAGITAQNAKPKAQEPVEPPELPVKAMPYPGAFMGTLEEGTYELSPGSLDSDPVARVTVPSGWNAWEGPNRFDGHAPGRSNGEALNYATWYVGLLVLQLDHVAARPCEPVDPTTDVRGQGTARVVKAITQIPGLRVTSPPERLTKFGHPAVHLMLTTDRAKVACRQYYMFGTVNNGYIGFLDDGADIDAWVVDVDGYTILVYSIWVGHAPPRVLRDLRTMIDSIEFAYTD
jgi:hypothetical protein